ncbi:glycine cleavage system protein R [Pseudoalteromonas luteoviolacea]|uniref:Glycine cleavage system transcriptional repressor n=1 Tax=Pseudoalteromonas luteoviolacea S4054 TaxID=1129367 RepID=A0A0F6ACG1_9GAMM|nr:ACT domain-containing protein [Pseudoalteromonas luteoviolacea]AOT09639.1 glycine cleavage system protein R [Pseudoalteromonas luteoviolacea]AOT14551.1 glycine cleavage system protein R [Pseudoalteromonas luteoviolacea]AOT19466.1 glycine cleavage system protein R [Pseudoalteromonas luteoviolacea]KKE83902.1 glycine cleavage system protein R [Pseudoalteromonas luteoviolacea S4054]KZN77296.1 glycine cleavage system protein R [Pseudoalteromonas luteoviolacea S4047-1]
MKQLVLTLLGKDRPGLVEEISATILQHHGNWATSNLSHLAGQFAGIVLVEVAEEHLQELQNALHSLPELEVRIEHGEQSKSVTQIEKLNLVITGNDRPGIIQELSTVIRHKGANITHLNSRQQSAPNWGLPIFSAFATVSLPPGMDKEHVVDALEAITSDLIVDVEPD